MFYKNKSYFAKTFYGVTFNPGDIKEVNGIVNDVFMIPVNGPVIVEQEQTKVETNVQQKPSSEKSKRSAKKNEESKQESEPVVSESDIQDQVVDIEQPAEELKQEA